MSKKWLLLLCPLLALACQNTRSFQSRTFERSETGRQIPYEIKIPKKENGKLVVILNENPDTLLLKDSPLSEYFFKENYSVLIPDKPGQDYFARQAMDNYDDRLYDVTELLFRADSLWENGLILIGFGEGGYLASGLAKSLKPTHSFILNAALQGLLSELQTLAETDTTGKVEVLMARKNIRSREDLKTRLQNISTDVNGPQQIGPYSNYWWKSYGGKGLMPTLFNITTPATYILSKDYLMISNESLRQAPQFMRNFPNVQFIEMEGNGNFNEEGQMEVLMEIVEEKVSGKP